MKESDDINELYNWINSRFEEYSLDKITEEDYLNDLEYYKQKLAMSESVPEIEIKQEEKPKSIEPSKVRSTSIAGLRKKLMEEMKR